MNLLEAWKISKIMYQEIAFNAMLQANKYRLDLGRYKNAIKFMKMIKRNALLNKIIISVFLLIGSISPYISMMLLKDTSGIAFSVALSISLLISFAFILFYEMQLLPYLINASGIQALRLFPLSDKEISSISLLTLLRTVDYPILSIIIGQIIIQLIVKNSIILTMLTMLLSLLNIGFAISIALFFSKLFYKFVFSGSKWGFIRFVYTLTWGLGISAIYFLPNILQSFTPYIENIMMRAQSDLISFLLLYPFPLVLLITNHALLSLPIIMMSIFYLFVIFLSIKDTIMFVQNVVFGYQLNVQRIKSSIRLKIRNAIIAIMLKDLRLASRTPNLAFIFVLPLFEVLFIITRFSFQFPSDINNIIDYRVISGILIGGFLSMLVSMLLLSSEFVSINFTSTLPIKTRTILLAKAFFSVLTYTPVLFIFLIFSKSAIVSLFTILSIIPIMAGSLLGPTIFLLITSKGSLAAPSIFASPIHALIPLGTAIAIIILPMSVYIYFSVINILYSVISMGIISLFEIIIAILLLSFLKD
jgi:hypothetical protein